MKFIDIIHVCYCLLKIPLRTKSTNGIDLPWSLHRHHSCTLLFTEDPTDNWIHKWIWICHELMKFTQTSFMYATVYWRPHWQLNPQMDMDLPWSLHRHHSCTLSFTEDPIENWIHKWNRSATKLTLTALTCAISYWRPNQELYPQMGWIGHKLTLTACHCWLKTQSRMERIKSTYGIHLLWSWHRLNFTQKSTLWCRES